MSTAANRSLKIREALHTDIPEIINVLKISLGESKLPKSEKIWRYKHIENPFGESLVMVALIDDKIIGIRSFMKWVWKTGGKEYLALRAVDTGILPEYQRQGVFQKLNQVGMELAAKRGVSFIFNTPNSKSLGANLKMNWEKIGKLRVKLYLANPIERFFIKKNKKLICSNYIENISNFSNTLILHNCELKDTGRLYTPKSVKFLKWRYEENPLQKYDVLGDQDFFIAAYIKKHKYFQELRIAEHIHVNESGLKKTKLALSYLNSLYKPALISCTTSLKLGFGHITGSFGPILTSRGIKMEDREFDSLKNMQNWDYSLGDLELF